MVIRLPINNQWTQPNTSDKFGSLAYTKGINLDEDGYIKVSPRTVNLFDDSANTTNVADTDFNIITAFGRYGIGDFRIATTDEPFNLSIDETTKTIAEDAGSNNPNLNFMSHGCWWQNRFYESTDTAVSYNSAGTWTANAITGLTSGVRHTLCVFRNRAKLCVTNGNTVTQYNTDHSSSTTLTLPSDFEAIGLAYNNYSMGVIARLGSDSAGQNAESYFFLWNGATTDAGQGVSIGAYSVIAIAPYRGSFLVLTSAGELKYWNGGGFETVATFPFYNSEKTIGDLINVFSYGDNMVVDGDVVYINVNFDISSSGVLEERYLVSNPSGVWCFDPKVGLYHRYSASNSPVYLHTIAQANVNTTTDLFTTSSTIPATGNPIINSSGTVGGVSKNVVYYIIKVSSTTFRLAETKEKAESGVYVDITSADTNNYFWAFNIKDYGIAHIPSASGAISLYGTQNNVFTDVIFGTRLYDTALTTQPTLCGCFPNLEARGYFVTPKIYASSKKDICRSITIKHRLLDTHDSIRVKVKSRQLLGLPVTTPQTNSASLTWTSNDEGYTTANLSAVKDAFDAGTEIECEFITGVGAGQIVRVESIEVSGTTYTIVFDEEVVGASAGLKSYFVMDNWRTIGTITSSNQNAEGIYTMPVGDASKWVQFKIELHGVGTCIEVPEIDTGKHSD